MIKEKKLISIFIIVLLLAGIFNFTSYQSFGVLQTYANGSFQGPAGANFVQAGAYPVKEQGLVYFVIEYLQNTSNNPSYAYVTGSFNGWNQTQYRMDWQLDVDGKWKIKTTVPMNPGTYEYKFILHWDQNPVWIDSSGWNGANSTFTLTAPTPATSSIHLRSSKNNIIPGEKVYLALDRIFSHGGGIPIESGITWSVTSRTGVSISNGVLSVASGTTVSSNQNLTVSATHNGTTYTKIITLQATYPKSSERKVCYFRYDNAYTGQQQTSDGTGNFTWNVYGMGGTTSDAGFALETTTDFGKVAYINTNKQFIIRKKVEVPGKWTSDWFEQTQKYDFPDNFDTVYIVEGDNRVFTDFRKAMSARRPKALFAVMDVKNKIEATLSNDPLVPVGTIKVYKTSAGTTTELGIKTMQIDGRKLTIILADNAVYTTSDLITFSNEQFAPSRVNFRNVLDELAYYDGSDLGITYGTQIQTKLWAPTASKVEVLVYDTWNATNHTRLYNASKSTNGTWSASIDLALNNRKFYLYRLTFYPGTEFERVTIGVDPFAQAVALNGAKGAFVNLNDSDTKPANWKPTVKPAMQNLEDAIIYELHIRDFSIGADSGISSANKGTYRAFTEKGTTVPGTTIKTGIDSLVELGVTHVQLLPFYDYNSVDEANAPSSQKFNWGYDPKSYNAPDGAYSTNAYSPQVRIKEAREMVQALHDANIRVVMDVVYNHTYSTEVFEPFVPGYYYRTDSLGRFIDDSGCGNTVATERKMVRKFIIDSLKRWAVNYNLDGFRFDLMGLFDTQTMIEATNAIRQISPTMMMYGEPWGGFVAPWTGKGAQKGHGFGVFNDDFRNAARGGNDVVPYRAYVTGGFGSNVDGIWKGIRGSIDTFAQDPQETINYVAAHDNYTLWDQIIMAMGQGEDRKFFEISGSGFPIPQYYLDKYGYTKDVANPLNTITQAVNGATPYKGINTAQPYMDHYVRRDVLASGIVLTSQGIPFIHAGDESLRSKYGDHNSYQSPDIINNKDFWNRKKDHKWVFDYYAGLIKLRKAHPAFRMTTSAQINQNFEGLSSLPANVVGFKLKNNANGDTWKNIVVIYNPNDWNENISLPGTWNVVVDDQNAGTTTLRTVSNSVTVHGTSMMVLYSN